MTTEAFLAEMRVRAAKLRGPAPADPAAAAPPVDGYRQAAAVLHVFDPRTLRPVDTEAAAPEAATAEAPTVPAEALSGLVTGSVPAVGFRDKGLRTLPAAARLAALTELGSRSAMRAALAANPEHERTGVQQIFETWLNDEAFDLGRMRFTELEALRQLYEWGLDRFGDLPDRAMVERAWAWRSSVRVFEHLVDRNFVGRQAELEVLRQFVRLDGPPPGPLVISGVGGAGKTALVGRFLIEQFETAGHGSLPFGYLPFDAETLDVREPYTVLLAAARQLSTASGAPPDAEGPALAQFQQVVANYRDHRGSLSRRASQHADRGEKIADLDRFERTLYRGFADLVRATLRDAERVSGSRTPALLVFDTFEEVAYRSREDLIGFWAMLDVLLTEVAELRVVIAGRAPAAQPEVSRPTIFLPLTELAEEDATSLLVALGVRDPTTAAAIARQVGGNPLSLRLAADVARAEHAGPGGLAAGGDTPLSVEAVGAELVRGRLYRRLLDHIHDPDVRTLAHPGMVLRRVTPEIIYEVLRPACGLDVAEPARAWALFDALRAEQALVSLDADGSLRYRPEVRRPGAGAAGPRAAGAGAAHPRAGGGLLRAATGGRRAGRGAVPPADAAAAGLAAAGSLDAGGRAVHRPGHRRAAAGPAALAGGPDERRAGAGGVRTGRAERMGAADRAQGRGAGALRQLAYGARPGRRPAGAHPGQPAVCDRGPSLARPPGAAAGRRAAGPGAGRLPGAGQPRPAGRAVLVAGAGGGRRPGRTARVPGAPAAAGRGPAVAGGVRPGVDRAARVLNPDDLVDPTDPQVGPVRRDLAAALDALTQDDIGREASLIRLALVRLGPHYPALVARLAPLVLADFVYLVHRGLIRPAAPAGAGEGPVDEQIESTVYELPSTLTPEGAVEDEGKAYALTRGLLDLMKAEKANLAGATLAGIDDYREAWELSGITEVRS